MTRWLLAALASFLCLLYPAGSALAHKVIPPSPPVRGGGPPEIRLESLHVNATVRNSVAEVQVEQRFVNRASVPAEGTYLFPLPPGATVSSFSMLVDGQEYNAEVLDAAQAREVYEGIVRRNRDPALLHYVGQGLLQARIFPVPPGEERRIRIRYTQVLQGENGLAEFQFPMGRDPVPQAVFQIDLEQVGSGTVYSPTHDVNVARGPGGDARASFEGRAVSGDFRLFFAGGTADLAVNILTYKSTGEDGYFLLVANPPPPGKTETIAKDVILVVDLSGSMAGTKFEQAKGAAVQVLNSLLPDDRFGIVTFHSDTSAYADELKGSEAVPDAADWVAGLRLGGATNIADAMARAQRLAGPGGDRPQVIIMVTDGQPTAGEQDPDRIVQAVRERATPSQRIFTFGVGYDVNTRLLDAMAQENRGRSEFVKPGENLELATARLWSRIGQPVLADLQMEWSGVHVEEIYPRPLPDLFLGNQMILLGRYRKGGMGSLALRGKVNGEERIFRFDDLTFAERELSRDYIARLWANRKVGYLLSEIRLRGANKELIDEVTALAQRYAIVTPYTSFFVNEPGQPMPTTMPGGRTGSSTSGGIPSAPAAAPPPQQRLEAAMRAPASGAAAVDASKSVNQIREARTLSEAKPAGEMAARIQAAGEKSFVLKDGIWTDTAYTGGELTHLQTGSDQYLKLIRARPDLTRYLAVGTPLILVDGSTLYGFDIPDQEESTLPEDALIPASSSNSDPVERSRMEATGAGQRQSAAVKESETTGSAYAVLTVVGIALLIGTGAALRRRRTESG